MDTAQPVNLPSALLTLQIFLKDFPQKADARLPNARKIPTAKSERIQAILQKLAQSHVGISVSSILGPKANRDKLYISSYG